MKLKTTSAIKKKFIFCVLYRCKIMYVIKIARSDLNIIYGSNKTFH